jgi:hypothetical protein
MTKRKLTNSLLQNLKTQGFHRVAGVTYGTFLHVYKHTNNGLILNLGIQSSRSFAESFTGAFYLSPTFTWGYMPPGFPCAAYDRVGIFLDSEERHRLLSPDFNKPNVIDAWWAPYSEENVLRFCEAVARTENRFLEQTGLVEALTGASAIKEHVALIKAIVAQCPSKDIPQTALEESVLLALKTTNPQRANKRVQAFLALDASRCMQHEVRL